MKNRTNNKETKANQPTNELIRLKLLNKKKQMTKIAIFSSTSNLPVYHLTSKRFDSFI